MGLVLLSNSSYTFILGCDPRYDQPLFSQFFLAIQWRHHISQVVGNGLEKPFPILQN
jgi:hypothetical protein